MGEDGGRRDDEMWEDVLEGEQAGAAGGRRGMTELTLLLLMQTPPPCLPPSPTAIPPTTRLVGTSSPLLHNPAALLPPTHLGLSVPHAPPCRLEHALEYVGVGLHDDDGEGERRLGETEKRCQGVRIGEGLALRIHVRTPIPGPVPPHSTHVPHLWVGLTQPPCHNRVQSIHVRTLIPGPVLGEPRRGTPAHLSRDREDGGGWGVGYSRVAKREGYNSTNQRQCAPLLPGPHHCRHPLADLVCTAAALRHHRLGPPVTRWGGVGGAQNRGGGAITAGEKD